MSIWSQLLIQERNSLVIQLLSLFHDYALAVMIIILIFVTGASIFMVTNKIISDSPFMVIVTVILAFIAIPSLQILYLASTDYNDVPNTKYSGNRSNYNRGDTIINGNWKTMLLTNLICLVVGLVIGYKFILYLATKDWV